MQAQKVNWPKTKTWSMNTYETSGVSLELLSHIWLPLFLLVSWSNKRSSSKITSSI
jgi:hypothetical protein